MARSYPGLQLCMGQQLKGILRLYCPEVLATHLIRLATFHDCVMLSNSVVDQPTYKGTIPKDRADSSNNNLLFFEARECSVFLQRSESLLYYFKNMLFLSCEVTQRTPKCLRFSSGRRRVKDFPLRVMLSD
jgi:hypothetical protein